MTELPRKSPVREYKDGDGHHWIVPEEVSPFTVVGTTEQRMTRSPQLDVWWNREPKKAINGRTIRDEVIVIRQENGRVGADVLLLTHGQAYDLIDALCRAVEKP